MRELRSDYLEADEESRSKDDGRDGKKIKLSIEVTPELNRVIERIADTTGSTKSEAV